MTSRHPRLVLALVSAAVLSAGSAAAGTIVIPKGTVWKYRADGTNLGTAWRDPGYDDSGWASGPAPLGFGEPYIATVLPSGPRTSYFRATFSVPNDPDSIAGVKLSANYDDGFVAYLNGQEVVRQSMPTGTIRYNTFADIHEGGAYEVSYRSGAAGLVAGANTIAVEVHQSSTMSSDLVLDLELSYSLGPAQVRRGPYLQVGTPTGITLRWRTDLPTGSRVEYGTAIGALDRSAADTALTTEHVVTLDGLSPGTRYTYAIGTGAARLEGDDAGHSFVTAPPPGPARPTRLWVVGDSGTADGNATAVRDAYAAYAGERATDVWLMLGDNAYYQGDDSSYQAAVFDMYPDLLRRTVLWPTRGNHDDIYYGDNNDYYDIFDMPTAGEAGGVASGSEAYYSFDYADIHFICLDSQGSDRRPGGAMLTWLASDLAATRQDWIIAFWHHPPYSHGSHNSDDDADSEGKMTDMRENALPILEAGGVDLVLTGHSHSYERSFLLNGHYGVSSTLTPEMEVDPGDGRSGGDGFYHKPAPGTPHAGAVYAVAGSAGQTSGGTLDHPVMVASLNVLGSMVIDIDGPTLDARFLTSEGTVADSFTIVREIPTAVEGPARPGALGLADGRPNPFSDRTRLAFALPAADRVRVAVIDLSGRRVRSLLSDELPAGRHEVVWDGRDDRGRKLGPGVYFVVLESGGAVRARRLVLAR